jgi:ubiquinone/menaquinone biosynthesis C-methylase UbiE
MRGRYSRVAPLYDLLDSPFEPIYARGRRMIGESSQGLTLEVGAGTGKNFAYYPPAARVVALDLSWAMLSRARRRIRPAIRGLLIGDLAHLPLLDASVDTVTGTFVCCVQTDPDLAAREIRRVLSPGGRAQLMEYQVPASGWSRWLLQMLQPLLGAVYGVSWQHDVQTTLRAVGLQIVEVKPVWPPLILVIVAAAPSRT